MMAIMNYGELPSKDYFVEKMGEHFPYPMELTGSDVPLVVDAINAGIDSYLEAIFWEEFAGHPHKFCLRIKDAASMYTLLRRLVEKGTDVAMDFVNCILYTLEIEWV